MTPNSPLRTNRTGDGYDAMDQHDLTSSLYWVLDCRLDRDFPPTGRALEEPDGLLAIGGDLSLERLLDAYRRGIFPWYSDGQPILWWSPDPRAVLAPGDVHVSRSLRKRLRNGGFSVTFDRCFERVIAACAAPRDANGGTWITREMRAAYCTLHEAGFAHSVECWHEGTLCGGLYGVGVGRMFFGESMFSTVSDASKIAFVHLCEALQAWDYGLVDCQIHTPHLERLGAVLLSRRAFEARLATLVGKPPAAAAWRERGAQA